MNFLNRKRQIYFILQEIPDLFSYHKYCILGGVLLYVCAKF